MHDEDEYSFSFPQKTKIKLKKKNKNRSNIILNIYLCIVCKRFTSLQTAKKHTYDK